MLISQRRMDYFMNQAMQEALLMVIKHGAEQVCR